VRAQIVLLAGDGADNTTIAAWLDIAVNTASKWRKRFACEGDRRAVGSEAIRSAKGDRCGGRR
jgi:hypothetical protein